MLGSRFQVSGSTFAGSVLRFVVASALCCVAVSGCAQQPQARVFGVYAPDSRLLLRLDYDQDGDGRIEVRTYMRDARPVRLEADGDGDGLVDRWEYYNRAGALLRIGASSQADGREDTWARLEGVRRIVDISTLRDGRADRREEYEGDVLLRAQSDTNHDGLPDRWEEFQHGSLARLLLDDDRRHGRPTRRIVYEAGGNARVEVVTADGNDAVR